MLFSAKLLLIVVNLFILGLGGAGEVLIGGEYYRNIDPGPEFLEDQRAPVAPRPEMKPNDDNAGMIFFETADPGEYRPWRTPNPDEITSRLEMKVTPGETTAAWFGIYALADLKKIEVRVPKIPGIEIQVRRIHCWPQRSGNYSSRTFHIIPELLLPMADGYAEYPVRGGVLERREFNLTAHSAAGIWISLKASDTVLPQTQSVPITVRSANYPERIIPVEIQVYPFRLPKQMDDARWILYCWPNRYRLGADPGLDIRDMREHGIDGFLDNAYLMVDLSRGSDGKLEIKDRASSIKWVEKIIGCAVNSGMRGPFGLWTTPVNRQLARLHGVSLNSRWPAGMIEDIRQVKTYFDDQYKNLGIKDWMSFASDEPKPGNLYAVEAMKAWKSAGAKTYCTAYFGIYPFMAEWLTDPCVGFGKRQHRAMIKENGARQWMIGDGCYIGNPEMARHRRRAGTNFYFSGAYGCAIWRWGGVHDDPFNDFDGVGARAAEPADQLLAYPQMREPDNWNTYVGPIPTIAWESVREGVNDYKYLWVLEQVLKEVAASSNPFGKKLAEERQTVLNALRQAVEDSSELENRNSDVAQFSTSDLRDIRSWCAQEIMTMQKFLKNGTIPASFSYPEATLMISPQESNRTNQFLFIPPPVISLASCNTPPRIDGVVTADEWKNASFVTIPGSAPARAGIMSDKEYLYFFWECTEPLMDRILPGDRREDQGPTWNQDSVEFFLVPDNDKAHKAAHLMVNHFGRWLSESGGRGEWDAAAITATWHGRSGYSGEMAVPWRQLALVNPLPWKKVGINFCRVRTPEREKFNTDKFNWAYGRGGFQQFARFGVMLPVNDTLQIMNTFSKVTPDGLYLIGMVIRNNGAKSLYPVLRKVPGRNLSLDIISGSRANELKPGETMTVRQALRPENRAKSWKLDLSSIGKAGDEIKFTVPSLRDLIPLEISPKVYLNRPGHAAELKPYYQAGSSGFIRGKVGNWQTPAIPFVGKAKESFRITPAGAGTKFFLEHLNNKNSLISRTEISLITLPVYVNQEKLKQ